jgi:hypothetical protein
LPDQELIPTPNETYEVSGQIRIQKGNKTNIRRFRKRDMERNGPVDDPKFYDEILRDFTREIDEEATQTTLPGQDQKKPDAGPKKITETKAGQETKKK